MINLIRKNAVLYKEMTVDMKTPKAMVIVLIMNLVLGVVAVAFLGTINIIGLFPTTYVSYRSLSWMFTLIYFIEATLIIFLVPALTAGSISLEKERQTLDVLLTTRMTPWEIILGKYFSNVVFISLLILSSMPILSLVFIYGGFPIWKMFLLVLVLFTITCFISSFGVFFSALTKSTIVSVILTYIAVAALFTITMTITISGFSVIEIMNTIMSENARKNQIPNFPEHLIFSDGFIFGLLLNPLVTVFDVLGNCIGYNFGETLDGLTINGMAAFGKALPHMTEKNILLKGWSVISVALQLAVSFGILRISAALVNPLKKPKKRKGDYGMK